LACAKWAEDVDLDLLDQFIGARYTMILDAAPWKWLDKAGTITTSAGVAGTRALYLLPSDLKILLEVNNADGNFPMRPYTQADLNMLFPGRLDVSNTAGALKTYIYSMAEDDGSTPPRHQVELYPIPEGVHNYPIRYTMIAPAFDPTQTSASPLPWIPPHILINGVKADLCALKEKYDGMQAFEALFAAGITEMMRVELHRAPGQKVVEADRYKR
jgi:hypothetical protein